MPLLISVAISSVFIPKRARRNSFASNPMLVLAGFPGMLRSAGATFGLQSHFTTRCELNKSMHLGIVTTRDTQVCLSLPCGCTFKISCDRNKKSVRKIRVNQRDERVCCNTPWQISALPVP